MGLRYTRIDTDAVAFNDEQNMNVLEAPIGVKFAGTFETAGWKVVPSYDLRLFRSWATRMLKPSAPPATSPSSRAAFTTT